MTIDIEPEPIGDSKIFFFDFHAGLHWLFSFDSFLNDFMDFVEIYSRLSYQVVKTYQVSIPNLNSKYIRIHVFRFRGIENREFETVVEVSDRSACPMCVCLLRFWCADDSSDKNIVRLHLNIFVDAIISGIDYNSQFIFIKRRRMYFMSRCADPLFLFNKIDPCF